MVNFIFQFISGVLQDIYIYIVLWVEVIFCFLFLFRFFSVMMDCKCKCLTKNQLIIYFGKPQGAWANGEITHTCPQKGSKSWMSSQSSCISLNGGTGQGHIVSVFLMLMWTTSNLSWKSALIISVIVSLHIQCPVNWNTGLTQIHENWRVL